MTDDGVYTILESSEPPAYRCGVPERLQLGESRWALKHLVWGVLDRPEELDVRIEMARAAAATSAICGLTFEEGDPRTAQLVMSVGRGARHDLDGRGGVLAWNQLPSMNQRSGNVLGRLDLDDFNRRPFSADPQTTILHETFGHGLGLPHLAPGSLMQPTADPRIKGWTRIDINALQYLYGPPSGQKPLDPAKPDQSQLDDLLADQRERMAAATREILGSAVLELERRIQTL